MWNSFTPWYCLYCGVEDKLADEQNILIFIRVFSIFDVELSMESVTLHEKRELLSMNNVDLYKISKIKCPWMIFTYAKQITFCE